MSSQRPQGGGILPPKTLKLLDELVDRLNASSATYANNTTTISGSANTLALLVGTNEGIPLSRSYGNIPNPQQANISDEVLSSIETVWATLPSATSPHAKSRNLSIHIMNNTAPDGSINVSSNNPSQEQLKDPPHPLLSHLGLGDIVQTTMAFYDHCTLIHIHMPPLVVTILATPTANVGSIKSTAIKFLKKLLGPVRKALWEIRYEQAVTLNAMNLQMQMNMGMNVNMNMNAMNIAGILNDGNRGGVGMTASMMGNGSGDVHQHHHHMNDNGMSGYFHG